MRSPWPLVSLLLLVLAVAGVLGWLLSEPDAPGPADLAPGDVPGGAAGAPAGTRAPELHGSGAGAATDAEGDADADASAAPPARYGALSLRVLWANSREPAASLVVRVLRDTPIALHRLRTDEEGRARWAEAPVGELTLTTALGGWHTCEVAAGKETDVLWLLPEGLVVLGRVQDVHGAPIAGADIWLGPQGFSHDGSIVTRTQGDGSFRLRCAETSICVGASAHGYAPSLRRFVDAAAGATKDLRFVLERGGGALRLVVRDHEGAPLSGADVLVGSGEIRSIETPEGETANLPTARFARTDEDGRASLDGLPAGSVPLFVKAPGHALYRASVDLAPQAPTRHEARLEAQPLVRGRVTSADGAPVAGARVRWVPAWASARSRFFHVSTASGPDGRYTLTGLPTGRTNLSAQRAPWGTQRAALVLRAGSETRWDPVLGTGTALRGRLVDARGEPLVGWGLYATCDAYRVPGASIVVRASSDAEGRFRLAPLEALAYRLEARQPQGGEGPPPGVWDDVRAASEERRFEVSEPSPSGVIRGVVGGAGGPPPGASVFVRALDRAWGRRRPVDASSGAFEIPSLPAGRYRLDVHARDRPRHRLPEVDLRAGETRDLGRVALPPIGSLVVEVRGPEGVAWDEVVIEARHADGSGASAPVVDGRARFAALYEGTYEIWADGEVSEAASVEVSILAGEAARLRLAVLPGRTQALRLWMPRDDPEPARYTAVVLDATGRERARREVDLRTRGLPRRDLGAEETRGLRRLGWTAFGLAPGAYRLRVATDTGARAELDLDVPAEGPVPELEAIVRR